MNVFKNTIANETICERVNILPNEHQNIVNFGDLLFTQSSETMEEVGFCSVWNSHKKVFLNSFCLVIFIKIAFNCFDVFDMKPKNIIIKNGIFYKVVMQTFTK